MEILIEKVKKYPCLWDTNSISYRDLERKEIAWENVSRECVLSKFDNPPHNGKEAKFQWKRLRDSHREALRRRRSTTAKPATKPWKYEKLMEFLQPQTNTETSSNYTNPDETEPNVEVLSPENAVDYDELQDEDPIDVENQTKKRLFYVLDQRERSREQRQNERDELRRQALDINRLINKQDALMCLFISMCEKTRALPKHLQLRVQREVFESVIRAEEEAMSDTNEYDYKTVSP